MVDALDHLLIESWRRVVPGLSAAQVARRIRRRKRSLSVPMRAWCLAVRASDVRIAPPLARMDPLQINRETGSIASHVVVLERKLLEQLTRPVKLRGLTDHLAVARELGVSKEQLWWAWRRGRFEVRHIKGLCGRRGKPVPQVYTDEFLDSGAASYRAADALWGGLWQHGWTAIAEDFAQEVMRRPVYVSRRGRLELRGFRWMCPKCGKLVRTLYYPLPRPTLSRALNLFAKGDRLDLLPKDERTFACVRCHRIRYFSRATSDYWNRFVSYVTDGMLYGKEVPRPADQQMRRRRAYRKMKARRRVREELVRRLLGEGKRICEIAREMGIGWVGAYRHVKRIRDARRRVEAGVGRGQ